MADQASSVHRQGRQGRHQEVQGRHAHLPLRRRDPVTVSIKGNVAPQPCLRLHQVLEARGRVFSVVAVVPKDNLAVSANGQKLQRRRCQRHHPAPCLHGLRRAHVRPHREHQTHPFFGLDFVHVELSKDKGWNKPEFAAFVSSIIEAGAADPKDMKKIRDRLKKLRLPPYDCLSPPLMDAIATHVAKAKGTLKT